MNDDACSAVLAAATTSYSANHRVHTYVSLSLLAKLFADMASTSVGMFSVLYCDIPVGNCKGSSHK